MNQAKTKLTAAEDAVRSFDGQNQLSDPGQGESRFFSISLGLAQQNLREAQISQQRVEGRAEAFSKSSNQARPSIRVVLGSGERDTLLSGVGDGPRGAAARA